MSLKYLKIRMIRKMWAINLKGEKGIDNKIIIAQ